MQLHPSADPSRFVVRFQDVAKELGIAPSTLRNLCRKGGGTSALAPKRALLRRSARRVGGLEGEPSHSPAIEGRDIVMLHRCRVVALR